MKSGNDPMDPITTAVVAAVIAGINKVGGQAVVDAYAAMKDLLKRKFGGDSKVVKAAEDVEANPQSKSRPATLNEEVLAAKADQDGEILKAAEALLAKLKEAPGGQAIVNQTVTGNQNIFSGTGNVTVHGRSA
jgi:hypothetical protein